MTPDRINTVQAILKARQALQRGDKRTARRWAEMAASANPELEEAWLILAEVANPRAAIAYLEQALKINPESRRALEGLQKAKKLHQATKKTTPPSIPPPPETPIPTVKVRSRKRSTTPVLILALVLALIALVAIPGFSSPAMAFIRSNIYQPEENEPVTWSQAEILKPTYTPLPTATFTPTPTSTPTLIPTVTSTSTPVALPSEEPFTYSSSTYTVQPGDTLFKIALRFGVELSALTAANNVINPATIYVGQQLIIPQGGYVPPAQPVFYGDKRILVDISEQHLYAYQGDVLVYSFVASTGMNNATRVGNFSVLNKIPNAYGANWNIWMPNWLGIYWAGSLQNGIHALPILPGGSRLWSGYLGTPISYGCVVLGVDEAQLLYDWAEIGTPVDIRW